MTWSGPTNIWLVNVAIQVSPDPSTADICREFHPSTSILTFGIAVGSKLLASETFEVTPARSVYC